jgi:hypothetical protein
MLGSVAAPCVLLSLAQARAWESIAKAMARAIKEEKGPKFNGSGRKRDLLSSVGRRAVTVIRHGLVSPSPLALAWWAKSLDSLGQS